MLEDADRFISRIPNDAVGVVFLESGSWKSNMIVQLKRQDGPAP
jgi:hypothetical protein